MKDFLGCRHPLCDRGAFDLSRLEDADVDFRGKQGRQLGFSFRYDRHIFRLSHSLVLHFDFDREGFIRLKKLVPIFIPDDGAKTQLRRRQPARSKRVGSCSPPSRPPWGAT